MTQRNRLYFQIVMQKVLMGLNFFQAVNSEADMVNHKFQSEFEISPSVT